MPAALKIPAPKSTEPHPSVEPIISGCYVSTEAMNRYFREYQSAAGEIRDISRKLEELEHILPQK